MAGRAGFIGKHNFPPLIHSLDDIAISRSPNKIRGEPASDNNLREPATNDVDKSWFENADFSLPFDCSVSVEPGDRRCASSADSSFGYSDIGPNPVSFKFPFVCARQVWRWPDWLPRSGRLRKDSRHNEKGSGGEEF